MYKVEGGEGGRGEERGGEGRRGEEGRGRGAKMVSIIYCKNIGCFNHRVITLVAWLILVSEV